jgi:hypothetical protein
MVAMKSAAKLAFIWSRNLGKLDAVKVLVVIGCVALSACATVAPYERERLSKPDMTLGRNADAKAGEEHATAYREGSTGAMGTSGGGCGCN